MEEEYVQYPEEESGISQRIEEAQQKKAIENARNNANNAQAVRVASQIASQSGNPYAMAAGKAINAADKITGGKTSERIGKALTKTNKLSPQGRLLQRQINKTAESGAADPIKGKGLGLAAIAGSSGENEAPTNNTEVGEQASDQGSGFQFTQKILKYGIIFLIPAMVVMIFINLLTTVPNVYLGAIGIGSADSVSSEDAESKINDKYNNANVDDLNNQEDTSNYDTYDFYIDEKTYEFQKIKLEKVSDVVNRTREGNAADLDNLDDYYPAIQDYDGSYNRNVVYRFFYKMHYLYMHYRNKYHVYLDVPLLMATLNVNFGEESEMFKCNTENYDDSQVKLKSDNDRFDYDKEISYTSTPTSCKYDMEILAQHMVSTKTVEDASECKTTPVDGVCYYIDEDKYREFLYEFIEKKYFVDGGYVSGDGKSSENSNNATNTDSENNSNSSSSNSTENSSSSDHYKTYRQCDVKWGNVKIGSRTICDVGCAITSLTILIEKSGTHTVVSPINPAIVKNYFTFQNNEIIWEKNNTLAPNFKYVTRIELSRMSKQAIVDKLSHYDPNEYYIVFGVKRPSGSTHFVAVDYIDKNNNKIYMVDPLNDQTDLFKTYSKYNSARIYKKGD